MDSVYRLYISFQNKFVRMKRGFRRKSELISACKAVAHIQVEITERYFSSRKSFLSSLIRFGKIWFLALSFSILRLCWAIGFHEHQNILLHSLGRGRCCQMLFTHMMFDLINIVRAYSREDVWWVVGWGYKGLWVGHETWESHPSRMS